MYPVIAGLSLALLIALLALAREVRLRRALQLLLQRLLNHWRTHFGKHTLSTTDDCARDEQRAGGLPAQRRPPD